MTRAAELFAAAAIVLLTFSLLSRFVSPGTLVSLRLLGSVFAFPPGSVCLVMAALLCLFAAFYSFWIFRMNQTAAMWHFWLTVTGITLFWILFYVSSHSRAQEVAGGVPPSRSTMAIFLGAFGSIAVAMVAQAIFIVNFAASMIASRRFPR